MKWTILFLLLTGCFNKMVLAQSGKSAPDFPVIGEPSPEITFSKLWYLPNVTSLQDLKGGWVILDFWTKGCAGCVTMFPKLDKIQKEFHGKVQIVLIGNNSKRNAGIEAMYEKFRVKQKLDLAVAYDSALFERFGIKMVPHVVIINPNGIVHAVTYSDKINRTSVDNLVHGRPYTFDKKYSTHEVSSDNDELFRPTDRDEIISGSFFSRWTVGQKVLKQQRLDGLNQSGSFLVQGVHLSQLYNYAYVGYIDWPLIDSLDGKWHNQPLLEAFDKSPLAHNYETGAGLYNYFLKPKDQDTNIDKLKVELQQDLASQFGYRVSIEERDMPVWILSASDVARKKLPTKHSSYKYLGDHAGRQFQNASVKHVLDVIRDYNRQQPPIVDESGIIANIDLNIDAVMNDFESVRRSLNSQGLILTKSTKKMKVIVLKDPVIQ